MHIYLYACFLQMYPISSVLLSSLNMLGHSFTCMPFEGYRARTQWFDGFCNIRSYATGGV